MAAVRRITTILLVVAVSTAALARGQVTETVLPNGLKVLIKEVHSAPVFTSQVWYRVGSRNEHTGITGLSHLVEHMMFKGTRAHGRGEFSRLIRAKGGLDNASTSVDFTDYWELLSVEHLPLALALEADRMTSALFDPKEFKAERTVVRSELEGRENDPDTLLYQNVYATAYQTHPYRWPIIGWTSDVDNLSRNRAYQHYQTYYCPNNATLVIVGDVDTQRTMALVRKYFGKIPAGAKPPAVYTTEPPQRGERRFVLRREGTAERVMIAYHIPNVAHPDTYPLMVLDQIISGGRSSRLYQSLVEGRLAVSVWSSAEAAKDPGLFLLGATGREGVNTQQIEKALLDEIEKVRSAPPPEEDLTRAKNQLQASLVYQNDSVSDQGEQLGYYETAASWRYLDGVLPNIKKVTASDVERAARKYFTEDNRTVGWFVPAGSPTGGAKTGGPGDGLRRARLFHLAPAYRMSGDLASRSAPAAGTQPALPTGASRPYRTVFDNGMVVIVQENHSNATVAIEGSLRAGGCFDPPGKKGLASFAAEMLSRGTAARSALEIARETDYVGAALDISSDTEAARFSGKALSKDFSLLLDVLSDELRRPSFPQDQIDRLKSEMVSRLDQEKESPESRATREFNRAIFPEGHPYRPLTIEEDQAATGSITRDDLVWFHSRCYGPETAVIVIVGDVGTQGAIAQVQSCFGDWKAAVAPTKLAIPRTPLAEKASRVIIPMTDKSQVDVVFGHAGQLRRTDPDYYAANVMNYILGGGSGLDSRLGKRIREQMGLVYFVYSWFAASLGDGPWAGAFGANPANVDKAIAAAEEEIRRYLKDGPTKKEFDEAIDYLVGVFPIRLETNGGVANVLLAAEIYGLGTDYVQRYPRIYRSVTVEQVRRAAREYLHPDKLTVVIAGPYKR